MKEKKYYTYKKISSFYINFYGLLGFLPVDDDDVTSNIMRVFVKSRYTGMYFYTACTIYNTMFLGYGIRMLLEHRLEIDCICEVLICNNIYIRYVMLYTKRHELQKLMRRCKNLWSFITLNEGEIVRIFERKVNFLKNFFMCSSLVASSSYVLTAQFVRIPSEDVNGTATKILPTKFYVEVEEQPWYTLVSILQALVCYSVGIILGGIESVAPFLILIACGYLRVIKNKLLSITKDNYTRNNKIDDNKLSKHEILNCVKFHQETMEFCMKIEEFTRSLFLVQISCTVYNMSLIGIKLLENDQDQMKYVTILVLNFMQFLTYQWIPEYLLTESKAIQNAAYSATLSHPHYEHDANQMLLFMMMRAQKPVQLTAGGYIKLSLETFQRMFVSAYSFFTVMR